WCGTYCQSRRRLSIVRLPFNFRAVPVFGGSSLESPPTRRKTRKTRPHLRTRLARFEPLPLAAPLPRDAARGDVEGALSPAPLPPAGRPAIGHSGVPTVGRVISSTADRVFPGLRTQLR